VDNNYLDLGMNKSGFVHTLPSGRLNHTSHSVYFNAWELLYECVFDALLFSLSYRPVGKSVSHHGIASSLAALRQNINRKNTSKRKLTVNAWLMVTMLVRRACISSVSSKISSYQGVPFQLISRRGNLGLEEEDSGTCAPDVPGPLGV
jgi:hypothetical protein